MENLLYDLYYNKYNFDGIDSLYQKAKEINKKIKREDVKEWLQKQATYQQSFNKVEKKQFLPIYSEVPNSYQIDLTFLPKYKKQNDNNYVLFTAIGINTRYAYADFSKDKKTDTVLNMFIKFDKAFKNQINHITGDNGSEFINNKFIKYLDDNNISHNFYKSDSNKLGIINRFHRTLKNKLTKYMIATDNVRWIDIIDDMIDNYNNTYNRGIKEKPIDVFTNSFLEKVIVNEKKAQTGNVKAGEIEYKKNDTVRVLTEKKIFEDKMTGRYTDTVYKVQKIKNNVVELEDDEGNKRTVKKNKLLKVGSEIDNYKKPVNIQKAKKENKIIRLMKKEDLIDEPTETRTRTNPKRKVFEDFV